MRTSEHILITGGTGFIGAALVGALYDVACEVTVLTRNPTAHINDATGLRFVSELGDPVAWPYTRIINLQGENLFQRRWTVSQKQRLRDSRITFTEQLVADLHYAPHVEQLISASAIGYYGYSKTARFTESNPAADDFAAVLCQDWEQAAIAAASDRVRVQRLRFGVVLGDGGALSNLLPLFRLGLGGPIGNGTQQFSWIHLIDAVRLIECCIDGSLQAPVINACAPKPVSNREFAQSLGRALRRPAAIRIPAPILHLILGESAELLTNGQHVIPDAAISNGFVFQFPLIDDALQSLAG